MKRQKPTGASIPSRLAREKIAPQGLKDLNETDDEEEENVQSVLQKRKVMAQVAPTPKRTKVAKPARASKEVVIPSTIPRHVKTRATKANPKIGDKE